MNNGEQLKVFSSNLRNLMDARGYTQVDLINKFNVSKSTAFSWWHGEKIPRAWRLAEIADWLGVPLSNLVDRQNEQKDAPKPEPESVLPEGYELLTPANRAIVDRLIADLAKSQSGD